MNIQLLPVAEGPDNFLQNVDALRGMVASNQFPETLYQLIRNEMVGLYNTWLRGLCGIKAQKKKAKAAQTCAHPLSLLAFFETSTYVKKL